MKPKTSRRVSLFKRIFAVFVIVLIGGMVYLSSLTNPGGDLRRYEKIKADFDQGRYAATAEGAIILSPSDRIVTLDGLVYATGNPPSLMLFPRWRGEGASIVATGWSAKPLRVGEDVDATLPTSTAGPETESVSIVPPLTVAKVRVTKKLNENWYVFERRQE